MSIIKLIRSFLKKPTTAPPQFADDWPPDGSVHFIDVTQTSQEFAQLRGFPEHFKLYEFSSNWVEQESNTIPLALEIMKRLCENRVVLTDIVSTAKPSKNKKSIQQEHFTVRYHNFLQKTHPHVSVYAENERKLNILTKGFHEQVLFSYEELDTIGHCYFEFYLFSENTTPKTAQQAWDMIQHNEYDIQLWINDSPVGLEVIFNPNSVDVNFVQNVIKDICRKHRVQFSNPQENSRWTET